jgi:tetratricopeptide (TPR) repeat protein
VARALCIRLRDVGAPRFGGGRGAGGRVHLLIIAILLATVVRAQDEPRPNIERCRQLAQVDPNSGPAVYGSAVCFEMIRDLAAAVNSYRRAVDLQFQPATAIVRMTSIFLVTGQYERALNEARRSAAQDCTNPQYHQSDFLSGEWEVQSGGRNIGLSSIQPILHGCALREDRTSWDDTGLSLTFYDPVTGKWHQNGAARYTRDDFEMAGEFRDGVMQFSGSSRSPHKRSLQRSTLVRLSTDQVRRIDEVSADDGNTWTVVNDLLYLRRK